MIWILVKISESLLTPIASIFFIHLWSIGMVFEMVSEIFWVRAADSILADKAPILTPNRFTFKASFLFLMTVSAKILALSKLPLFKA